MSMRQREGMRKRIINTQNRRQPYTGGSTVDKWDSKKRTCMYYMWVYRFVSICAGAFHSAQESKTYFNKTYDFSTTEYMHRNMKIDACVYTNYTHTHCFNSIHGTGLQDDQFILVGGGVRPSDCSWCDGQHIATTIYISKPVVLYLAA